MGKKKEEKKLVTRREAGNFQFFCTKRAGSLLFSTH